MAGGGSSVLANDSRGPRVRPGVARNDPTVLAEGLDRLREAILQRLNALEALAGEQIEGAGVPSSDRERALREKVATLEASHARLHAEFRRREQEWEDNLAQVEHDRKLLTEAWERLEQEQADVTVQAEPDNHAGHPGRPAAPVAAPTVYQPSGDSVTTAILREFEALRGDIRRNAKSTSGR